MRNITTIISLFVAAFVSAQIGIGTTTPHGSAALDITNPSKGFKGPSVALVSAVDASPIASPKVGLLVYNTATVAAGGGTLNVQLDPGYYYWTGTEWTPLKKDNNNTIYALSDGIDVAVLGYHPRTIGANASATTTYGGITATKKTCFQFYTGANATHHSYCGYDLSGNVSWQQAYNIAKNLGGYIVTITSNDEWNYVKTNLLDGLESSTNSKNASWLGYTKLTYFDTNPINTTSKEFIWITGERSIGNWTNNSTAQNAFAASEPNGTGNCTFINSKASNASRLWADAGCGTMPNSNFLIVEFQF